MEKSAHVSDLGASVVPLSPDKPLLNGTSSIAEQPISPIVKQTTIFPFSSSPPPPHPSSPPFAGMLSVDWPEKASSFMSFVKERGISVSKIMRRLSEKLEDLGLIEDNDYEERGGREEMYMVGQDPFVGTEKKNPRPMKGRVTLFSRGSCQDCRTMRSLLRKKGLSYVEINIDIFPQRKAELEERTGTCSVPQTFFNEVLMGGIEEMNALYSTGELDQKVMEILGKECPLIAPEPPVYGDNDPLVLKRDEFAPIVKRLRERVQVKDRFHKMRLFSKCFLGADTVEVFQEYLCCSREEAIEFGRKVAGKHFFHHVLRENLFEDGYHLYRFLEHDPAVATKCYNVNGYINDMEPLSATEVEVNLRQFSSAIIDAYVSEDGKQVDYRSISTSEEFRRYLKMTQDLHRVDVSTLPPEQKLAFFINLYNLMMIHAIIILGHPEGWLDRRKLFADFQYLIGGFPFSVSDVQNGVLRANRRPPYQLAKPFGPNDKRVSFTFSEPDIRVHFALTNASKSSPALKCYSPDNINAELKAAACAFFLDGGLHVDLDTKTVTIDKMIDWFSIDFGKNEAEILRSLIQYLEPSTVDRVLELLDGIQFKLVYGIYDWSANS